MQKMIEKLGLSEGAASAALWVVLSLVLLGVVALVALWLVRTLRPSLNIKSGDRGGRPQRLAITDAFALDREGRKLVIVRRDNVEHLLLIGGPNDVLVEGNITRHDRAARGLPRAPEAEAPEDFAPPPAVSLPPAPAPVAPPAPPRPRAEDMERPVMERRPAAPLSPVLAPVLTPEPRRAEPAMDMTPPAPPVVMEEPPAPPPPPQPAPTPPVLTLEALLPDATPVTPPAPVSAPMAPPPAPPPAPEPVVAPPAPPPQPAPRAPAMSEMARRLNEALQKPVSGTLRPPFNRSIPPVPPTMRSAPPAPPPVPEPAPAPVVSEPAPPPAPEPKIAQAEPEPVIAKADMDLLEEEMARLLGRPSAPKGPGVS